MCIHTRTNIYKGEGGRGGGRGEKGKGKREGRANSLSIAGVYLKTVLQVAIESHK